MAQMLQAPDVSRARTKLQLREDYSSEWAAYCEVEAAGAWEQLASPPVVAQLAAVLERLGGRKGGGGGGAPPSRL